MAALPLTRKRNESDRTRNRDKTWLIFFSVIYKVRSFVPKYRISCRRLGVRLGYSRRDRHVVSKVSLLMKAHW